MTIRFLNKGKKQAEILVYGEVGESWWGESVTAKKFAEELKALGDVDAIDLRINSYGGDVFEGMAIYQRLVQHGATITSYIDGTAMSIASVIACAGSKIVIAESGSIMIHDAWTIAMGNAAQLSEVVARLETTSSAIADVYVARTGKTKDEVRKFMAAETEWFGQDAVDAGFADEVAENLSIAARNKPDYDRVLAVLKKRAKTLEAEPPAEPEEDATVVEFTPAADDERRNALRARRQRLQVQQSRLSNRS